MSYVPAAEVQWLAGGWEGWVCAMVMQQERARSAGAAAARAYMILTMECKYMRITCEN